MCGDRFELQKNFAKHKIYDVWQFVEYAEQNLATVHYCADILKSLIEVTDNKTVRWEQSLFSDFIETKDDTGKKVKKIEVRELPNTDVRVVGQKINPWFLFDKLIRDFFQYAMNTFDSMAQIANAGLFANSSKQIDSVDFQRMETWISSATFASDFPLTANWFSEVLASPEFKYIEAINNRTKHTARIANKLSIGLLGSNTSAKIGPFFRKNVQHDSKALQDQLDATLDFLEMKWNEFKSAFEAEYVLDKRTKERYHTIDGVKQQVIKGEAYGTYSCAYIVSEKEFSLMPDEFHLLLVREREKEILVHNAPFDSIFVCDRTGNILQSKERYIADSNDALTDDCLIKYRKYVKDATPVSQCINDAFMKESIFYYANPFFNVETVTNDKDFLQRIQLPI